MLPAEEPPVPRPDDAQMKAAAAAVDRNPIYIWSYLLIRAVIGSLGLALPVMLIVVDWCLEGWNLRGSLSAYYHSGARDLFVGTLVLTGIFLITYKIFSGRSRENWLSTVAGVAALGVALFPAGLPAAEEDRLTPLQKALTETVTTSVHFSCAFLFIGLLGWICYLFARREGARTKAEDPEWKHTRTAGFWRRYHLTCASFIAAAVLFIAVTKLSGFWQDYSLLVGEVVAVWAFGLSWLAKGREHRNLWKPKQPDGGNPQPRPASV